MGRFEIPDHPEIACIERTGYPSWMQEDEVLNDEDDEEDYDSEFWGDDVRMTSTRKPDGRSYSTERGLGDAEAQCR